MSFQSLCFLLIWLELDWGPCCGLAKQLLIYNYFISVVIFRGEIQSPVKEMPSEQSSLCAFTSEFVFLRPGTLIPKVLFSVEIVWNKLYETKCWPESSKSIFHSSQYKIGLKRKYPQVYFHCHCETVISIVMKWLISVTMKLSLNSSCSPESSSCQCGQGFSPRGHSWERFLIAWISPWKGVLYLKEVGGCIALQESFRHSWTSSGSTGEAWLKASQPWNYGLSSRKEFFILCVKHAHTVGVKRETGRGSRQMKEKKGEKKNFKWLPPPHGD